MKDNDEVVFIGGYATEVNQTTMSCPLGVGIEAMNVIPRCISSLGVRLRFREECTTRTQRWISTRNEVMSAGCQAFDRGVLRVHKEFD